MKTLKLCQDSGRTSDSCTPRWSKICLSQDSDLAGDIGRRIIPVLSLEIVGSMKSATSSAGCRAWISRHPDFKVSHQGILVKLMSGAISGQGFWWICAAEVVFVCHDRTSHVDSVNFRADGEECWMSSKRADAPTMNLTTASRYLSGEVPSVMSVAPISKACITERDGTAAFFWGFVTAVASCSRIERFFSTSLGSESPSRRPSFFESQVSVYQSLFTLDGVASSSNMVLSIDLRSLSCQGMGKPDFIMCSRFRQRTRRVL